MRFEAYNQNESFTKQETKLKQVKQEVANLQLNSKVSGIAQGPEDGDNTKFGSEHNGLTHFMFLDGHIKALKNEVDYQVFNAAGTIGGDEMIPEDAL